MRLFKTYILLFSVCLVAMLIVHCIPRDRIADNSRTSVAFIHEQGRYPRQWGREWLRIDNFTDALMLNMAYCADADKPLDAALSNVYYTDEQMDVFSRTEEVVLGNVVCGNDVPGEPIQGYYYPYARYWHGYQVFLRPLLVLTDYQGILRLNALCFYLILLFCLWTVGRRLSWAVAILFLLSLLLVALPVVPLCLQLSTCFYIAFLAVIAVLRWPSLTQDRMSACCTFFVTGGLTAYFDLLTTPMVTLGLPLTVCLLSHPAWQSKKYIVTLTSVWSGGYVLLWLSKCIVAQWLTDYDIIGSFLRAAQIRSVAGTGTLLEPLTNAFGEATLIQVALVLACATVLGLMFFAICCRLRWRSAAARANAWLLLIAFLVPIWYVLTLQHSCVHYWFTWRSMAPMFFVLFLYIYRITTYSHEQDSSTHTML